MWPIYILRYSLPLFCFGFFGQIFLMFTTIFYCRKSESSTSPYLKCRPGHWFNNIKPIAGIAMFLHFFIAFITNSLYYKPIFMKSNCDLLKKSNSLPDIIFLFTKMIIITIFILDKGEESEHWAIVSFLVFITGINAYCTVFYKNRQNKILLSLNNFFSLVLFSGFLILFISKVFKFLGFNGSIFLFFSCVVLIIIFIILYKNNHTHISMDYKNIYNPEEYLQYLSNIYNIIKNKNNSRDYSINLQSIISYIEENCLDKMCPLNKYLLNLEKGLDREYLLLEFCDKLFKYGISKFNGNIFLKNNYSIFLINEMNNKKKSLIVLESIKNEIFSLETNYNIYRCRKIIEKYSSPFINKNNSIFHHRAEVQQFKIYIKDIFILYYQFFSLLLENKIQIINNFEKINEIGHQIKKLNKKIENLFAEIINNKTDNNEVIKLYLEYVEIILKDKEKYRKCQKLKNLLYNKKDEIHENDYSNYNLDFLKCNSNSKYLIISSNPKSLGYILDCSTNLCYIFGYQKSELIGSHINILIPEILQKKHDILISQKAEVNILNFLEGLYKNSLYVPNFVKKEIYCISKAKFLIPLNIKIYLVNSEENILVYIAEISNNSSINLNLLKKNINPPKYCILTDKNFLIQSFTPNCANYLNINYEDISCNCNIINYIRQFKNDYLNVLKETSISKKSQIKSTGVISLEKTNINIAKRNISPIKKQKIKNDIYNKKYFKRCKINWNASEKNNSNIKKEIKEIIHNSSVIFGSNIYYLKKNLFNDNGMELYMESRKIILDNELLGYYFYFSKIYNFENNNCYLNYKSVENNGSEEDIKIKKSKKYQCLFKSIENEKIFPKVIKNLKEKSKRNSLEKMIKRVKFKEEDKSPLISEIEDIKKKKSKYSSTTEIQEVKNNEDIIIDENYIPNCLINFSFNTEDNSYNISKNINNNKLLNESLKKEAIKIINIYNEKERNNHKNSFNSFDSSNESYYESEEFSSSKSISKSYTNELNENINYKNNKDSNIYDNSPKKKDKKINNNLDNNNEINIKNNKTSENNNFINNYHKVDLSNIHLMIYNFNTDSIIEEKNINNFSEIENIKIRFKNSNKINIGKDENYPFVSLKANKSQSKNNMNKVNEEEENKIYRIFKKENLNKEDKLHEEKVKDIINNNKDEIYIKYLKRLSLISYFIMIFCGIINTYFSLTFYSTIKEIFNLVHISAHIRYCEGISIYYVRELSLLCFNIDETSEGTYIEYPARDKNKYISILKKKLNELFIESQSSMKKIFSSFINLSKESLNFYKVAMNNFTINNDEISDDLFTLLVQYNSDFYSFTSNNNDQFEHFNSELFNYIHNNFNKYRIGLNLLIDTFGNEYNIYKRNVIIYFIIINIAIFFIFIIIYIYISKYFFLANQKRKKYFVILYGINSDTLKISIKKFLNLINNLKNYKESNNFQNEESNYSNKTSLKSINDKEKKSNINNFRKKKKMITFNNQENNKNIKNNSNYIFIILFGFFLLILYSYFMYNFIHLFNLFQKSDNIYEFATFFQEYQNQIIDLFNIYREYLYDNETKILNYTSLEYLRKLEEDIYDFASEKKQKTDIYINNLISSNEELIPKILVNFCSLNITDFFSSIEECNIKFKVFVNYEFFFFSNYFLEEIKIAKNIVRYKLENENIKGNLNKENIKLRMNLFNNQTIHGNLNLIFINSLLPYLQYIRKVIFEYNTIDGEDAFGIKLSIIYFILLTILFLFLFFLIIKFLNVQIKEEKNMLSIIPISTLTSQNNNKNFLDIFIE